MNRSRALRKTWKCAQSISLVLALHACASQDSFQAKTDHALDRTSSTKTNLSSTLVRNEYLQEFPHLRGQEGQFVLMREGLQLVIPGVPLLADKTGPVPLVSRVFRQEGKSWTISPWLSWPEIEIETDDGKALELLARDLNQGPDHAEIVSIFRSSSNPRISARMTLRFLPLTSALEVRIESSKGQALRWSVRIGRGTGEELSIPFTQDKFAGVTMALLPELYTLISATPLSMSRTAESLELKTLQASTDTGFYLLLDQDAWRLQARLAAQAIACYKEEVPQTNLACLQGAWNDPSPPWNITQSSKSPPRSDKKWLRPLFIQGQEGAFRSLVPIGEGEQIEIGLSKHEAFELLYPDAEGVLQHFQPEGPVLVLVLPEIPRGVLHLDLKPNQAGFLELRDAVQSDGLSLQTWSNLRSTQLISPHTILQKSWPFQTQLPAGDYRLHIYNGHRSLCQQRFTIRPGKRNLIACQLEGPAAEVPLRGSLSLDSGRYPKEMFEAAQVQISGRDLKAGGEAHVAKEIPWLEVNDPDLGLSLRAFPIDDSIRAAWTSVKTRTPGHRLQEFVAFARSQTKPIQILLECPSAGFQLDEYAWLALTLEPDFLEVFGCRQTENMPRLLSIAASLQQKSKKAVKLAAASPWRSHGPLSKRIPVFFLKQASEATEDGDLKSDTIIDLLSKGAFTLGYRSEIDLPFPSTPGSLKLEDGSFRLKIKSYELSQESLVVRIQDEFGLLNEINLAPTAENNWDIKVPLTRLPRSHWVRVELLSQNPLAEDPVPSLFLLATSNFLRLNDAP